MRLTLERGVAQLPIIGDFELIIDWINGINYMKNILLIQIMERIKELKGNFANKYFQYMHAHTHRIEHLKVDALSKEALALLPSIFKS